MVRTVPHAVQTVCSQIHTQGKLPLPVTIVTYRDPFLAQSLVAGHQSASPRRMPEGEKGRVVSDLTEVCLDMMARYTYSNLSSLPSR